ncbi:hypothetical protein X797_010857 [Metarhizium robertsii]|uniref:Uncharacterized protein n=1 Tax=Metarhizium robertsii TaxID=568076 RepID=A0A014PJR3_9HYPO|nr:hypothetical protein X797_010857 [Metarhizium robertsii]
MRAKDAVGFASGQINVENSGNQIDHRGNGCVAEICEIAAKRAIRLQLPSCDGAFAVQHLMFHNNARGVTHQITLFEPGVETPRQVDGTLRKGRRARKTRWREGDGTTIEKRKAFQDQRDAEQLVQEEMPCSNHLYPSTRRSAVAATRCGGEAQKAADLTESGIVGFNSFIGEKIPRLEEITNLIWMDGRSQALKTPTSWPSI